MPELLLKLENITFGYTKSQQPLLKEVNFALKCGEKIGIIGDNGSGKSTIVKLLLGLHRPKEGEGTVKLFGKPVDWGNHYPMLGYIGDPSYNSGGLGLPTGILVKEVIDCFKKLWGSSAKDFCSDLLEQLDIPGFYETDVAKLSNGQRKRLMAFLALAKQPLLLIADEPTEGLDAESKKAILSAVRQASLRPEFGMLWISHRRCEVAMLAHKVYELSEGQLADMSIKEGFRCELKEFFDDKNLN